MAGGCKARPMAGPTEKPLVFNMIHGISSYVTVSARVTTSWFNQVLDAGIEIVELFCARQSIDYRNQSQIAEFGHWFRDAPLKVRSVHSPLYSDDCWGGTGPRATINLASTDRYVRRDSVDEVKRALEIAEYIPFQSENSSVMV